MTVTLLLLTLLLGIVAGMRAMAAAAAVSWAARPGWLNLAPASLAFLGLSYGFMSALP